MSIYWSIVGRQSPRKPHGQPQVAGNPFTYDPRGDLHELGLNTQLMAAFVRQSCVIALRYPRSNGFIISCRPTPLLYVCFPSTKGWPCLELGRPTILSLQADTHTWKYPPRLNANHENLVYMCVNKSKQINLRTEMSETNISGLLVLYSKKCYSV